MNNGKSMLLKRMAIAAVCVGMVGSGGLVQAMKPWWEKPVKPLTTGKIPPVMTQMIHVPASKIASVPLGDGDKITQVNLSDFQIGKAEVTGALWSDVYNWAIKNGYKFANTEENVGTDKPVTRVSWYDVIVWANAYSEKLKLQPVYLGSGGKVLNNATNRKELNKVKPGKGNGYRLPTGIEWELAARWLGTTRPSKGELTKEAIATKGRDNKTTYYWTPANYASGATDDVFEYKLKETLKVAWFDQGSAKPVCTKATNVLGICDMSGNVWEWQSPPVTYHDYPRIRGGSWDDVDSNVTVSSVYSGAPSGIYSSIGFRLARIAK